MRGERQPKPRRLPPPHLLHSPQQRQHQTQAKVKGTRTKERAKARAARTEEEKEELAKAKEMAEKRRLTAKLPRACSQHRS